MVSSSYRLEWEIGLFSTEADLCRDMAELLEAVVLDLHIARIAVAVPFARLKVIAQEDLVIHGVRRGRGPIVEMMMATVYGTIGTDEEFRRRAFTPFRLIQ